MKLTILFLLIFSITVLNAQLYVAPSEKSDSYIYAKDRLIFVNDEIHLIKNKSDEKEASLYLRKGSQLLQADKIQNRNKGDGSISVFQKGTSNAYDYNYWGLPVFVTEANPEIIDYLYTPISKTESKKAKLISDLEGISDPLSISRKWIYTYAGTTYSNWQYLGDHFDLLAGEGFSMKGVSGKDNKEIEEEIINNGAAQTYDFRGTPNDGSIELPIKKEQVLLVGNPYPSALDLDKFLLENTATTGIAYFWDSKKNGNSHYLADYEGGYGTYSPGTGIYLPPAFKKYGDGTETGQIGDLYPRSKMPIAQGFMIIGKKEGLVHFQNSQRIYQKESPDISIFKSSENSNAFVILNIELDSLYITKLALAFNENSTVQDDHGMDAKKMESTDDIGWIIGNELYLINVRPKIDEELIPLKIKLKKETVVEFSVASFSNFNPDRMFLYDAEDDLYFGIKTGALKMQLPAGDYHDRFFISFIEKLPIEISEDPPVQPETLSEKLPIVLLNTIDIFQNNKIEQLEVKILYDTELKNLKIFDLNGKLHLNQNFKSKEKEFYFSTGNLSNAVYIVQIKTSDNRELTKKIGVKN